MVERHKIKVAELQAERLKSLQQRAEAISKYKRDPRSQREQGSAPLRVDRRVRHREGTQHRRLCRRCAVREADGPLKQLGMYTVRIELHRK